MVQLVVHTSLPGANLLWIRLLPVGKYSIIALDVNPSSSTQNNLGHTLPGGVVTSILSGHSGTSAKTEQDKDMHTIREVKEEICLCDYLNIHIAIYTII